MSQKNPVMLLRIETDGHEMYCRMCGNGGEIMECDNKESIHIVGGLCPFSFCTNCIRRNFGEEEVSACVCVGVGRRGKFSKSATVESWWSGGGYLQFL